MTELTEEQKQEAAAKAERERQEAATAQPSTPAVSAGSGSARPDESVDELKLRLNADAKSSREKMEASQARTKELETEMATMRAKADEAKKEAERAEMSAVEKAEAERDDLEKQLAAERVEKNRLTVEQAAIGLAGELGFRDPTLAAKLIDVTAATQNGQIDLAVLRAQVEGIAQKNEYLLTKPPPATQVGPTNNAPNVAPEVLAPSSVNLRPGADPRMALMEQKKAAQDNMRDGRDPKAAAKFVDAFMKHRDTSEDAVYGRMHRDVTVPLKEKGG